MLYILEKTNNELNVFLWNQFEMELNIGIAKIQF
jgi:hypothetical protein